MKDVLLALCVGLAFALGLLPMRRLDRFLERRRESVEWRREVDEGLPAEAPDGSERGGRALRELPLSWGKPFPLRHRG